MDAAAIPLHIEGRRDRLNLRVGTIGSLPIDIYVAADDRPTKSPVQWQESREGPNMWEAELSDLHLGCVLHCLAGGGVHLRWTVRNTGLSTTKMRRLRLKLSDVPTLWPAGSAPSLRALKIAYCGAHSRSRTSRSTVEILNPDMPPVRSWWATAVAPQTGGPSIVAGGLDFERFLLRFDVDESHIAAVVFMDGLPLPPGNRVDALDLSLDVSSGPPFEALEAYASDVGRRHNVQLRAPPCGWGSWGRFSEQIDAGLIQENLLALDGCKDLRDTVNIVQIDDGWSTLLESHRTDASWLPNRRFPMGIATLSAQMKQRGKQCGLWLLPFTVNGGAKPLDEHPDHFVHAPDKTPWRVGGGDSYCIDPTHPRVRATLTDLFSRFREWGIRYIKLDHLRALLMPDPDDEHDGIHAERVFHDACTRVEAYRSGLRTIRDAVGPDVFIVGCSAPAGPGMGLVNAHRIGPDIEPSWNGRHAGIRDSVTAIAANYFWQGRTWNNDPDFLLGCRSVEETVFWATSVALSGGSAMISADFCEMPKWQEDIFSSVTPPIGRAARPIDLFRNAPCPNWWHLPIATPWGQWDIVGVLNWLDNSDELYMNLAEFGHAGPTHLWDVWRKTHRIVQGEIQPIFVPARSARLFALRTVLPRPQMVGTARHFSQGLYELSGQHWHSAEQILELQPAAELSVATTVYIWAPRKFQPQKSHAAISSSDQSHQVLEWTLQPGATNVIPFSM